MGDKLRVLYVLNTLGGGGSEMLTYRLIKGLQPAQFDFAVVCLVPFGSMIETMRNSGARLYLLEHRGGIQPRLALDLRRLIRREQPDIINTHHIGPLLYTRMALSSLVRRPPHVHTVHVLPEVHRQHASLSKKAAGLYHFLLGRADHVVCVSQYERARLRQVPGLPASRVTAIPNGIAMGRFQPSPPSAELRKELGIAPGTLVVSNIGAFRRQKNQACLVEAFGRLLSQRKDAVLLLAGGPTEDGVDLKATQDLARSLNLGDAVRFLGPRPDVPQILATSDVYAQPSLYEGLPLSVMEAMAMQRAVVATDVGGNNELIRHEQTGLLVPPNDPQAMCDAILRFLADSGLRASLGDAARELVSKAYTESCMIDRYEMLYRILAHRSSRRPLPFLNSEL